VRQNSSTAWLTLGAADYADRARAPRDPGGLHSALTTGHLPSILRRIARPGFSLIDSPVGQNQIERSRWRALVAKKSRARKRRFVEPHQADLGRPVLSKKIIHFSSISFGVFLCPSRLIRGAYRDRHGRGARDAVDATASGAQT